MSKPNELRQLADDAEEFLEASLARQRELLTKLMQSGQGSPRLQYALAISIEHTETAVLWLNTANTHGGEV
jgi:hypothetical protein